MLSNNELDIDDKTYKDYIEKINLKNEEEIIKESSHFLLKNLFITLKIQKVVNINKKLKNILENENIQKLIKNNKNYKFYQKKKKLENSMKFRKRIRKKKDEIDRKFNCNYPNCKKSYGTENSLAQHIKIKHEKFN